MAEGDRLILGTINQCRLECRVAARCFQIATSVVTKAQLQPEAMLYRADHPVSELKALEPVELREETSLVTGKTIEFLVWEARYEVPKAGEAGQAFFAPGAALQN